MEPSAQSRKLKLYCLLFAGFLILGACGGDDSSNSNGSTSGDTSDAATPADTSEPDIETTVDTTDETEDVDQTPDSVSVRVIHAAADYRPLKLVDGESVFARVEYTDSTPFFEFKPDEPVEVSTQGDSETPSRLTLDGTRFELVEDGQYTAVLYSPTDSDELEATVLRDGLEPAESGTFKARIVNTLQSDLGSVAVNIGGPTKTEDSTNGPEINFGDASGPDGITMPISFGHLAIYRTDPELAAHSTYTLPTKLLQQETRIYLILTGRNDLAPGRKEGPGMLVVHQNTDRRDSIYLRQDPMVRLMSAFPDTTDTDDLQFKPQVTARGTNKPLVETNLDYGTLSKPFFLPVTNIQELRMEITSGDSSNPIHTVTSLENSEEMIRGGRYAITLFGLLRPDEPDPERKPVAKTRSVDRLLAQSAQASIADAANGLADSDAHVNIGYETESGEDQTFPDAFSKLGFANFGSRPVELPDNAASLLIEKPNGENLQTFDLNLTKGHRYFLIPTGELSPENDEVDGNLLQVDVLTDPWTVTKLTPN